MPELPEVETVARTLRAGLIGRTVVKVRAIDYPALVEPLTPVAFSDALEGRRIVEVGRRGKYIRLGLDNGATLTVHLRMSGRLSLVPAETAPDRHTRAILELDDGQALLFHNPRKFGRMRLWSGEDYSTLDARLGPEPLDSSFNAAALAERLRPRPRARLKPLLLDQCFLAGLGNIYADETLFRARLHPLRQAGTLAANEIERLYEAVVSVLWEAIAAEGTTLADGIYRFGTDQAGRFAGHLQVYGREEEPCSRCATPIQREQINGRSSYFCPLCQPSAPLSPNRPRL